MPRLTATESNQYDVNHISLHLGSHRLIESGEFVEPENVAECTV